MDGSKRLGRPLKDPERGPLRARVVRVDDPTWDAIVKRAERDGISSAEAVQRALRAYVKHA